MNTPIQPNNSSDNQTDITTGQAEAQASRPFSTKVHDGSRIRFTNGPATPPDGVEAALSVPASPTSNSPTTFATEQEAEAYIRMMATRQARAAKMMAAMEHSMSEPLLAATLKWAGMEYTPSSATPTPPNPGSSPLITTPTPSKMGEYPTPTLATHPGLSLLKPEDMVDIDGNPLSAKELAYAADNAETEAYFARQDKQLTEARKQSKNNPEYLVQQIISSDIDPQALLHVNTLDVAQVLQLPDPVYLLDGYLSEDSYAVLYGRSQSFKSFVALDWAMQISRTRPVIYIAGEGKLGYRNRIGAWLQHHNLTPADSHLRLWDGAVQMGDAVDVERFLSVCAVERPALIVMDTLSTVTRGLDENSSRDMGIFVGAVQRIRHKTGACVLVVHHSGKDGSRGHRGSSKIIDDADTAFCVERKDMSELVTNLRFEKAKDADLGQPLALTLEKVGNSLVPVSSAPALLDKPKMADHMLTAAQRKVLIALDNAPDGLSHSELIEAADVPKANLSRWMNSEFSQYVERVGEGIGRVYVLTEAGQDILAPWNITA